MRVDELCHALGLSRHAVRFHLAHLLDQGQVRGTRLAPDGPGRPGLAYRALPPEAVDDAAAYRALARHLGQALTRFASLDAAEGAGRAWAAEILEGTAAEQDRASAVRRLVDLLDEYGFLPHVDGNVVELHRCPYLAVAMDQPAVVCSLHMGLIRGLLGPVADTVRLALTPVLDGSGPCLLDLTPVPVDGVPMKEHSR